MTMDGVSPAVDDRGTGAQPPPAPRPQPLDATTALLTMIDLSPGFFQYFDKRHVVAEDRKVALELRDETEKRSFDPGTQRLTAPVEDPDLEGGCMPHRAA